MARAVEITVSADGVSNVEQGRRLNIDRQRARRWRSRWAENQARLAAAEQEGANESAWPVSRLAKVVAP